MNKLPLYLVLALTGTACQPQATSTPTTAATAPAAQPVAVALKTNGASTPGAAVAPGRLALLRRYNVAPLLQSLTNDGDTALQVQNGFFGPAGYRIEMALTRMQPTGQPGVFEVQGKSRYKKVITPFSGTISITQVVEQPQYSAQEIQEIAKAQEEGDLTKYLTEQNNQPDMYTAIGTFELREDATQRGAGVYRGTVALDFRVEDGTVLQESRTENTLTQGGAVKYAGTWTNNATGRVQPVVWVQEIINYRGPQVFKDFIVGSREIDFNPKYARLGWNTYWQNDEWWADAPKPTAAL
ncbi:MAG: hypothetical protein ACRYFX_28280 [Janthinobacterium lividum]